jgi:hypothetical protein
MVTHAIPFYMYLEKKYMYVFKFPRLQTNIWS